MITIEQIIDVIDDYISHIEEVNEERLEAAEKEVELARKDCLAFSVLVRNMKILKDKHRGIS